MNNNLFYPTMYYMSDNESVTSSSSSSSSEEENIQEYDENSDTSESNSGEEYDESESQYDESNSDGDDIVKDIKDIAGNINNEIPMIYIKNIKDLKTRPFISEIEKATVLSIRASQIAQGAIPAREIGNVDGMTSGEIARLEYDKKNIPISIKRQLDNYTEVIPVRLLDDYSNADVD